MSEHTSKIHATVRRIHITTGEYGETPSVTVDGYALTSGKVAAERIERYADRHGLSMWDVAQCVYWPAVPEERAHRRNIAHIVQRALGF